MAENFFSILKTECIYRHKPRTFREANDLIDRYIHFYNHERIQNIEFRHVDFGYDSRTVLNDVSFRMRHTSRPFGC